MTFEESFDKNFFYTLLWRELKKIRDDKWITLKEMADKMWVTHVYISNLLNGRWSWNLNTFKKVASTLWLTETQFNKIVDEAKKAEYEHTTWNKIWSEEDFDFEVALRKEYWQELDDYTVEKIKDFIEHVKFLKKNEK
jgi:transcriptional regulator with XRE-family HTH domain